MADPARPVPAGRVLGQGGLAFLVSPIADNLTTALLLGAIAMAVGRGHPRFITLACINIVVAANAGGAFSPFGDITPLMVWQAGRIPFTGFFALALPSLVNWLVPAVLLSLALRGGQPAEVDEEARLEAGALSVLALFLGTIALTVALHSFLDLPPLVGMMAGLGLLKSYSYWFNRHNRYAPPLADELDDVFAEPELEPEEPPMQPDGRAPDTPRYVQPTAGATGVAVAPAAAPAHVVPALGMVNPPKPLDIFAMLERIEWDTLMFFYGVLMGVGGLGALGYLAMLSGVLYGQLGASPANILVGVMSALVDNVPVMFAVLQMSPSMSEGQWLLVTLTTGVGGSLLSLGSAAGVALMGQARGIYTFGAHLRWSWAVGLGYAASIGTHLLVNARLF